MDSLHSGGPSQHLHRSVTESNTLHETSFFRDKKMFDALRETILPRLIQSNRAERTLHIWSAATSTGQEAYSVAMLIADSFPELAAWDVRIVGTDISEQVVRYARRARYLRSEMNCGLPARLLVKHFVRDQEQWEAVARVTSMCEFECADLSADQPARQPFDLVLLRNMLLYCDPWQREGIFRKVRHAMKRSAYLLLGLSEQAEDSTDLFEAEYQGNLCYYRPSSGCGRDSLRR